MILWKPTIASLWHCRRRHFCLFLFLPPNLGLSMQKSQLPQSVRRTQPLHFPQERRRTFGIPICKSRKLKSLFEEYSGHCFKSLITSDCIQYLQLKPEVWTFLKKCNIAKLRRDQILVNLFKQCAYLWSRRLDHVTAVYLTGSLELYLIQAIVTINTPKEHRQILWVTVLQIGALLTGKQHLDTVVYRNPLDYSEIIYKTVTCDSSKSSETEGWKIKEERDWMIQSLKNCVKRTM